MPSTNTVAGLRRRLREVADPQIAAHSQRFFKTGPGEYGEGDRFVGVRIPVLRKLAKEGQTLPLSKVESILHSKIHEERMLALLILNLQYRKGDTSQRRQIVECYRKNLAFVNNWDLVDTSAHQILGDWLRERSRQPLYKLAKSADLWERRVAIIATYTYIKADEFDDTLKISRILLLDQEDLIQKAVGWMLREVGNRDLETEEKFLKQHYLQMPRTMLRYAIEKLPEEQRQRYLKGKV